MEIVRRTRIRGSTRQRRARQSVVYPLYQVRLLFFLRYGSIIDLVQAGLSLSKVLFESVCVGFSSSGYFETSADVNP